MKRKQYSPALKAKIVIEALRETKTITELAAQHQIHPNLITKWKQAAIQDLPSLFERGTATLKGEPPQTRRHRLRKRPSPVCTRRLANSLPSLPG